MVNHRAIDVTLADRKILECRISRAKPGMRQKERKEEDKKKKGKERGERGGRMSAI
jgi:hypothetical protein